LGAGRSSVSADAQVLYGDYGRPQRFIEVIVRCGAVTARFSGLFE
jgi:hypothetical protein